MSNKIWTIKLEHPEWIEDEKGISLWVSKFQVYETSDIKKLASYLCVVFGYDFYTIEKDAILLETDSVVGAWLSNRLTIEGRT